MILRYLARAGAKRDELYGGSDALSACQVRGRGGHGWMRIGGACLLIALRGSRRRLGGWAAADVTGNAARCTEPPSI